MTPTLYDLDRAGLGTVLSGEPRYRLDQLWQGLYEQFHDPAELTTIPKTLRARLADQLGTALRLVVRQ